MGQAVGDSGLEQQEGTTTVDGAAPEAQRIRTRAMLGGAGTGEDGIPGGSGGLASRGRRGERRQETHERGAANREDEPGARRHEETAAQLAGASSSPERKRTLITAAPAISNASVTGNSVRITSSSTSANPMPLASPTAIRTTRSM